MYDINISEKLDRIMGKLAKKDRVRYEAIAKKIEEIRNNSEVDHYKNLSYRMKIFKRVHIDSHFVLIFNVDKENNLIYFDDLQHHDDIYR